MHPTGGARRASGGYYPAVIGAVSPKIFVPQRQCPAAGKGCGNAGRRRLSAEQRNSLPERVLSSADMSRCTPQRPQNSPRPQPTPPTAGAGRQPVAKRMLTASGDAREEKNRSAEVEGPNGPVSSGPPGLPAAAWCKRVFAAIAADGAISGRRGNVATSSLFNKIANDPTKNR